MTAATVARGASAAAPAVAPALFAAVDRLFAGQPVVGTPSVGVELELIPVRRVPGWRPSPVPVVESRALLAGVPFVAFEPGGQIELNPPPQPTARLACSVLASLARMVVGRLRPFGVDLIGCALDPWHADDEVGLQLPSDRYVAMDAHFERIGPSGRSFMRRTASTQVCVDLAPGDHGRSQWRAARLLAPIVAAVFANAPMSEGRLLGDNGRRTAITLAADPARMGHDRSVMASDDVVGDYVEFAAGAQPISDAYAGAESVEQHLTTLFPPVRPRSTYLEMRAIDSLPLGEVHTAVTLVGAVLADRRALADLEGVSRSASLDTAALWSLAAGPGVRDQDMRRLAVRTVDVALASICRLPGGYLPDNAARALTQLRSRVSAGVAPGDITAGRLHAG